MRPSIILERHREDIRRIVASHHGSNPRVFGSVARGEDEDGSDLDIVVDFPELNSGLRFFSEWGRMKDEIADVTGLTVDLLTTNHTSEDFLRKILPDARTI